AEISRQNGKKSRGPVTDAGKAISRQNAIRHGLCATILALPNEDPELLRARTDAWHDYYKPQSPAAYHYLNECVRATVLADRVDVAQNATLTRRVRNAVDDWDLACD